MNKKIVKYSNLEIISVLILLVCGFNPVYSQTVKIGNELFPVSFEDASLDVVLQTNIVQDLNRYFAYTKSFDYDFPSYKEENGKNYLEIMAKVLLMDF